MKGNSRSITACIAKSMRSIWSGGTFFGILAISSRIEYAADCK